MNQKDRRNEQKRIAALLQEAHGHYYNSGKDFESVYYAQADYLISKGLSIAALTAPQPEASDREIAERIQRECDDGYYGGVFNVDKAARIIADHSATLRADERRKAEAEIAAERENVERLREAQKLSCIELRALRSQAGLKIVWHEGASLDRALKAGEAVLAATEPSK